MPAKVYIDTSTIMYFLYPPTGPGKTKAQAFFDEVEHSKYAGIISDFCKLEYYGVLKRTVAERGSGKVTNIEIKIGLDQLDQLIDGHGLEVVSADALLASPFVANCMEIIEKSDPTFVKRQGWKVVKGADSVHVVLASRCGAQFLATMDCDFRGLRDSVQPMVLWDKY